MSERFVVGTQRRLAELMRRDLSGLRLVALLIDGVHFAEHVVLAGVGIDVDGEKHPLGLREGATENAAACKALLEDMIERGLNPNSRHAGGDRRGQGAAPRGLDTFGARALIQRCQAHKKRNVTDALPERMRASVRTAMDRGVRDSRSEARPPAARASRAQAGIGSSGIAAASLRERRWTRP